MRKIFFVSVFFLMAQAGYQKAQASGPVTHDPERDIHDYLPGVHSFAREWHRPGPEILEKEILEQVNAARRKNNLPPLVWNEAIAAEARKHSADMASKKVPFSHNGFKQRVKNISNEVGTAGYSAENVAHGYLTGEEVVNGWMHSEGHRKNIEGQYKLTGIGVAKNSKGDIFFTQIFITPL